MDQTEMFEAERPRLVGVASRVLGDHAEAEDVVQQAWLRLHRTDAEIDNLPAWLTTVTTRLCLDRLRSRTPVPVEDVEPGETVDDPADDVALADTVGLALQVVLDRLSPRERVAFVLHDSFGFEFPTIAAVLDTTPAAARKLASRARAKVAQPACRGPAGRLGGGRRVHGRSQERRLRPVAATARTRRRRGRRRRRGPGRHAAADRGPRRGGRVLQRQRRRPRSRSSSGTGPAPPGSTSARPRSSSTSPSSDGLVRAITFRAAPDVLSRVVRRDGGRPRG